MPTLVLTRPPGAAFEYCNMNYNLLGLVVEVASDEAYTEHVGKGMGGWGIAPIIYGPGLLLGSISQKPAVVVARIESGYGLEQRLDSPREFFAPAHDHTDLYLQEIGSPASEK